jgi:hypothetical protein
LFQLQIPFYGLVANPVKTISLPDYLLSCERKVLAGVGAERGAKGLGLIRKIILPHAPCSQPSAIYFLPFSFKINYI